MVTSIVVFNFLLASTIISKLTALFFLSTETQEYTAWLLALLLDRIRNERIRGTAKVGEICEKELESRLNLKWHGHVLRREEEYVGKSDGDGGAGEERKRKTESELGNDLFIDGTVRGGSARPG